MLTDEQLDQRLKMERRKIFWRLHFLPWVTIVILLIYAFIQRDRRYIVELDIVREESYRRGVSDVYKEAINLNYGGWGLDINGESKFIWREGLLSCTEWEDKIDGAVLSRDIPLVMYSDLRGFNLQRMITKACTESIDKVFDGLESYERIMRK